MARIDITLTPPGPDASTTYLRGIASVMPFMFSGQPLVTVVYTSGAIETYQWDPKLNKWGFVSTQQLPGFS